MIKIKGVFFLIDFHLSIKNFSVRTNFYLVAKRQKLKNARFLEQISFILRPLLCIKMLVISCHCAIALIHNETPTSKMKPLFDKRNHLIKCQCTKGMYYKKFSIY